MRLDSSAGSPHAIHRLLPDHNLLLMVSGKRPPTDTEWRAFLRGLRSLKVTNRRILAISGGGAPNAARRSEVRQIIGDQPILISVITEAVLSRMAIRAVRLFNPSIRAFSPRDIDGAFDFVGLSPGLRATCHKTLIEIQRAVGVGILSPL